ncbi:MAG: hypothetical protein KGH56_01235 [Patescibacteria group bacterium]|nr:hypothetical protein [Patescibacteria group bacterium]
MKHMRLGAAASIIALVILVGFVLSVPHAREVAAPQEQKSEASTPTVILRDTFKKGVHTISGSVEAPNACTSAGATASVAGASTTPSILVAISLPVDTGFCLQAPTQVSFQTTVAAPARLPISVTVNGEAATTSAP